MTFLFLFSQPLFLVAFLLFIGICLALDLGVFSKKSTRPTFREAGFRTLIWAAMGILFSIVIWYFHDDLHGLITRTDFENYRAIYDGKFTTSSDIQETRQAFAFESVIQYISGYFVEYSLSLDNLFVMMLIFKSFKVHHLYERKILFWGVLGAILMRFIFIFIGGSLIAKFNWILYVFGAFLVYSGFKLLLEKDHSQKTMDTHNHPVVKWISKFIRISDLPPEGKFFTRKNGKWMATSLFVVLVVIEFSDVVFAVDSVPAIFGITHDPFLVFFSNIFAILGLRSLFFLLRHSVQKFHTLQYGLSLILIYIGAKMLAEHWFDAIGFNHIHNLLVLFGILSLSFLFAFIVPDKRTTPPNP